MRGTSLPSFTVPTKEHAVNLEDRHWDRILVDLDREEEQSSMTINMETIDTHLSLNAAPSSRTQVKTSQSMNDSSEEQKFPPIVREIQLIDINCDLPTCDDRYTLSSSSVALLQLPYTGFIYDMSRVNEECELPPGSLLKPLSELDDPLIIANLKLRSRKSCDVQLCRDVLQSSLYAVVPVSSVMRLTDEQTMLLLAIEEPSERISLYRDLEVFDFIRGLKIGDEVLVEIGKKKEQSKIFPGKLNFIGDRPRKYGTWFGVEIQNWTMNGSEWESPSRTVYAAASQIHKPTRNSSASVNSNRISIIPDARVVPIQRLDTCFQSVSLTEPSVSEIFAREMKAWGCDLRPLDQKDHECEGSRDRRRTRLPMQNVKTATQPSRSHSSHSVSIYEKTFSVDDIVRTKGAKVGDRCDWKDGKQSHKGTIKFLGHLKGHASLYAGIDFDEPVGRGTGVFQGETIFKTAENHAGFVLLSALEIIPRSVPNEMSKRQLTLQHKQASAESLSDPPPVPPRPILRAEDYMIDSFVVGSSVEVCHLGACRSGVILWMGDAMSEDHDHIERSAVVELNEDVPSGWRSSHEAPNSDTCGVVHNGVLVPVSALRRDRRIDHHSSGCTQLISSSSGNLNGGKIDFGSIDSGIETIRCEPWRTVEDLVGRMKGIQGHRNSCYLDATLYAMFVQSTSYDFLLERPTSRDDIPQYKELQRLLATEIVYPLRKFHYVRADHIMKVREVLANVLTNMRGLTSEEKDPEEILVELFGNILRARPFVEFINLKDNKIDRMFLCPLIVDDWSGGVATTQHLLERSMREAGVKFVFPPKTLILQLPRYGQQKLFDKILPLERIEITGLVNNAVQACHGCGKPAEGWCPECFLCKRILLTEVSFCTSCHKRVHNSSGELDHAMRAFYPSARPVKKVTVHKMILSAVLCIETSHYVAYVRTISGRWLFFDSMADREGLSDGFNVPQVKEGDKISWWLSQAGWERLREADDSGSIKAMLGKGSDVDPLVTRLLSDSYICFYQEEVVSPSSNILNNVLQKVKPSF